MIRYNDPNFLKGLCPPFVYHAQDAQPEDDPVTDLRIVIDRYEAMDVLNGALIFESSDKRQYIFETENLKITQQNEYPNNFSDIYFREISRK